MTSSTRLPLSRAVLWIVAALGAAHLYGCASVAMPAPSASAAVTEQLRSAKLTPAAAGKFALAAGKDAEMDRKLGSGLRGSSLAPASGSFSQQLKDQLVAELKAAGLYDENSKAIIEARLTDSQVDAAIGTGKARLAAHFTVDRQGTRVYDKELSVESSWESSFVGAVALPAAINQYTALYKALIAKLFDDPQFRAAMRQ